MKKLIPFLMILCLILSGCGTRTTKKTSFMMDTVITYSLTAPKAGEYIAECEKMTEEYEAKLSAYKDGSIVSSFNENGEASLTEYKPFDEIIRIAIAMNTAADGAFDITVAPLVKLWDITHAGDGWRMPEKADITEAATHVGMDKLSYGTSALSRTDGKCEIDLGGIAKGYALGAVMEHVAFYGTAYGTISFGGNIALVGNKPDGTPWNVGIKDPFDTSKTIATMHLDAGIVSVSGSYERYVDYEGKRYHHIIDPETGYPAVSDLVSVAVWVDTSVPFTDSAEAGAYADAISTALFIMGKDEAVKFYDAVKNGEVECMAFEAMFISSDGEVSVTEGLYERYSIREK